MRTRERSGWVVGIFGWVADLFQGALVRMVPIGAGGSRLDGRPRPIISDI
jgi:hypothetical protein